LFLSPTSHTHIALLDPTRSKVLNRTHKDKTHGVTPFKAKGKLKLSFVFFLRVSMLLGFLSENRKLSFVNIAALVVDKNHKENKKKRCISNRSKHHPLVAHARQSQLAP
jgi:hypothetical protein